MDGPWGEKMELTLQVTAFDKRSQNLGSLYFLECNNLI